MGRWIWDKRELVKLLCRHEAGESAEEIARSLGVSRWGIDRLIDRARGQLQGHDPTTDVAKVREYGRQCMPDPEGMRAMADSRSVLALLRAIAGSHDGEIPAADGKGPR